MADRLTPDICVIGAGSGGLSLAAGAVQFGLDVVLVEKGEMGGDCLNYGCVPSKALIAAARHAAAGEKAEAFGVRFAAPEVDFEALSQHIQEVISAIAPNDSAARYSGLGVRVIRAEAQFTGPREVEAGEVTIAARHFVIAAGSAPLVPPIAGLAGTPFLTNETVFGLTRRPEQLLVLGGGPIGLELAQAYRRLGVRVTVLEAATLLAREDRELAMPVIDRLVAEGIDIRAPARVIEVAHKPGRFTLRLETAEGQSQVVGSHLLVAAGRAPSVDGLGLERADIEFSRNGIVVNRALRTTNRRVHAIGDIAGRGQFTHLANYHAGAVLRSILTRWPYKPSEAAIPRVTFTDPELATVGLSYDEAHARHGRVNVLRWAMADNDRAQADRETAGMIKVVTTRSGRILGAGIVGAGAGELIHPWILAITKGLDIKAMTEMIAPYPTYGEISKRAAFAYYAPRLIRSRLPRLARFLVRHV